MQTLAILSKTACKKVLIFFLLIIILAFGGIRSFAAGSPGLCTGLPVCTGSTAAVSGNDCCCSVKNMLAGDSGTVAFCDCTAEQEPFAPPANKNPHMILAKVSNWQGLCSFDWQLKKIACPALFKEHFVESRAVPIYILHCSLLL